MNVSGCFIGADYTDFTDYFYDKTLNVIHFINNLSVKSA